MSDFRSDSDSPNEPRFAAPENQAPAYRAPEPTGSTNSSGAYPIPPQEAKLNALSVVSLVSAFFISLVAIITGHIALRQIKQKQERGLGLAVTGLVLGYLGIVLKLFLALGLLIALFFGISLANSGDSDYGYGEYEEHCLSQDQWGEATDCMLVRPMPDGSTMEECDYSMPEKWGERCRSENPDYGDSFGEKRSEMMEELDRQ